MGSRVPVNLNSPIFSVQGAFQQMTELAAAQSTTAKCPTCGMRCDVAPQKRSLQSVDGAAEVADLQAYCTGCRRSFFPAA